jgi:uncharacterized protein (DUF983 family)
MVDDTNMLIVSDTKPRVNCCSRCGELKLFEKFIKNRNICKECDNTRKKDKYKSIIIDDISTQECNTCNQTKLISSFIRCRKVCKDCNNEKRQNKYHTDEEHRITVIKQVTLFKQNKIIERHQIKLEEIGEGNKKCSICFTIKEECNFRHNRLKCKDCERDDPVEKFKRNIRSRIWGALNSKNMHTIVYLGCSSQDYLQWILTYNENYTLDNHGNIWHIDHVIPISRFNLEDIDEQLLAFNWRNTMPLLAKDNLAKNNKIIPSQIEQHLTYLKEYHETNNIELPQIYIDLFCNASKLSGTP